MRPRKARQGVLPKGMLIESVKAGFRNLTVFIKAGQSGLGMRIHSVIKTMIQ